MILYTKDKGGPTMQYPKGRKEDIQRVLVGATRCLNPHCSKPFKYAKYKPSRNRPKGYCCRECQGAYTPTMVYFARIYGMPFRQVLVMLLNMCCYQKDVARELGVQAKTVSKWIKQFEVKREGKEWL